MCQNGAIHIRLPEIQATAIYGNHSEKLQSALDLRTKNECPYSVFQTL